MRQRGKLQGAMGWPFEGVHLFMLKVSKDLTQWTLIVQAHFCLKVI